MKKYPPAIVLLSTCCLGIGLMLGCGKKTTHADSAESACDGQNDDASSHYTARPIPHGPNAFTENRYETTVARPFFERYWFDPFNASAEAHAPWANEALRVVGAEVNSLVRFQWKDMTAPRAEAEALVKKGCTYPVILWMYARHLNTQKKIPESIRIMADINRTMATNTAWPTPLRVLAAYGLARLETNDVNDARLVQSTYTMLTDGSVKASENFPAWVFMRYCGTFRSPALEKKLETVDAKQCDPWFRLMLEGEIEYRKAWDARGGGWAYTVTEQGWKIFGESIKKAQKAFTAAWRLHPEISETSHRMIDCSLGDTEACRCWFDRAVAAQMDYIPAYRTYIFSLRPRWCGSLEEMASFADECLNTGRYDTDVPLYYITVFFDIADELGEYWQAAFQKPGVYENCKRIFEKTRQRVDTMRPEQKTYFYTAFMYLAYAAGDYDAAIQARTKLMRPGKKSASYNLDISPPYPFRLNAITGVRALNGIAKTEMRKAEGLARSGHFKAALEAFGEIASIKGLNDLDMDYISLNEIKLRKVLAAEADDWFSLLPAHAFVICHRPWYSHNHSWFYWEHAFRTRIANGRLYSTITLPRNIELAGTVICTATNLNDACDFGLALDSRPSSSRMQPVLWLSREKSRWTATWVKRFGQSSLTSEPLSETKPFQAGVHEPLSFFVRSRDDTVSVTINKETVFDNVNLSDAFIDTFHSGRLLSLYGTNIQLTEWKAHALKSAKSATE